MIEPTRYALLVQAEIYESTIAQETLDAVGFSGLATIKPSKRKSEQVEPNGDETEVDEVEDKKPAAKKTRTSPIMEK